MSLLLVSDSAAPSLSHYAEQVHNLEIKKVVPIGLSVQSAYPQAVSEAYTRAMELRSEFEDVVGDQAKQIKDLKDRFTEIQQKDTKGKKLGRALQAIGWGTLLGLGFITIIPAFISILTTIDKEKYMESEKKWYHRLSFKSEAQLSAEEEWNKLRRNWNSHSLVNPLTLEGRIKIHTSGPEQDIDKPLTLKEMVRLAPSRENGEIEAKILDEADNLKKSYDKTIEAIQRAFSMSLTSFAKNSELSSQVDILVK